VPPSSRRRRDARAADLGARGVGRVFVLDAAKMDAGDGERARREVDAPRTSHHQIEKAHVGFGDEIRIL
jgi:hypothetical protein